MSKKIVIIGGGYAGVLTTKKLIKGLKKEIKTGDVEITLIDKNPYHTLLTELHEVAFDRIESEAIKIYYSKIFNASKVNVVLDTVTKIDYKTKTVIGKTKYQYDYLVESTGAKPLFFGIDGAEENSYPMWSFKDTQIVKNQVIEHFNRAELSTNEKERRELLTFVVAGAGFTGVEVVGELNEWISKTLIYKYPTINLDEINVTIIDGASRVLGSFKDKAANRVEKHMTKKNINIICNKFINKVTPNSVHFGDEIINTQMVIWTSGITCAPIDAKAHKLEKNNRIVVTDGLESSIVNGVYVLGDIMYYIPAGQETSVPQMVENCELAAPIVAHNIINKIRNEDKEKTYNPTFHGAMASIGGRYGVAELQFGKHTFVLSSFFAMFVKHFINIVYFVSAAGLSKVWIYIKDEIFNVEDRRSFIGSLGSAKSPAIYLVPLRLWLGFYWLSQGLPKLIHKLQGGWQAICVETSIFPKEIKSYGNFCEAVYPSGKLEFLKKNDISAVTPSGSTTVDAAASASDVVEEVTECATDGATSASDVVADVGGDVVEGSTGILDSISNLFTSNAPVSTDYGLGYDFGVFPTVLTDLVKDISGLMLKPLAGLEWLMELSFDGLEVLLGVLLIIGLWRNFSSIALLILSGMIAVGSFLNYGVVVEGLIFSIVGAIALIGIGGNDSMPISVDYFLSQYKKEKKRKRMSNK